MADDVASAVTGWVYEAVVEILSIPAKVLRDLGALLHGIVVFDKVALLEDAIEADTGEGAVGTGGSSKSRDGSDGGGERLVHCDRLR